MRCSVYVLNILILALSSSVASAQVFVNWDFSGDVLDPSVGAGRIELLGVNSSFVQTNNRALNLLGFAPQSQESGERGIAFFASTVGYQDISISFDHRSSPTASRWAAFEFTLDGGVSWQPSPSQANNNGVLSPPDQFYQFEIDLTDVAEASNNADFGFRVVSIFSPLPFDQNVFEPDYAANTGYMSSHITASYELGEGMGDARYTAAGTWRFDNVAFSGTAVPEPSSIIVLGCTALLVGVGRYRHGKRRGNGSGRSHPGTTA